MRLVFQCGSDFHFHVDLQIRNVALILRIDIFTQPIRQEVCGVKIIEERCAVNDRDTSVQSGDFGKTAIFDELSKTLSRLFVNVFVGR